MRISTHQYTCFSGAKYEFPHTEIRVLAYRNTVINFTIHAFYRKTISITYTILLFIRSGQAQHTTTFLKINDIQRIYRFKKPKNRTNSNVKFDKKEIHST